MTSRRINLKRPLEDYIQYFEKLNPRSIRFIEKLAEPDMRFVDPFNDVTGLDNVEAVLEQMFEDVDDPKFRVLDYAWGQQEDTVYIKWIFSYKHKSSHREFEGMSEVRFSSEGKVVSHIDHWDAARNIYETVPVLGFILRKIRKHVRVE